MESDRVRVSHRRVSDVTVIRIAGELDVDAVDEVTAAIDRARRSDDDRLVFDLGGLEFLDNMGLRALIAAWKHARAHGGAVHLAALRPNVRWVLDVTQLNAYLPIHADVEDAVRAATAASADAPAEAEWDET
ncbi:STAS domain-containing protein [Thermomonospora cellulosilytica]|uniref:Anti-sigma factor antagonist n=1 Tax=Thermomonospora cellulosilytica TaxID=1411118 RepID=A0A7W3N0H5_9ACTN|nr:STAS domain-containing protein [Thermomonospora cellulosilytica]MBA9005276.1 anti-anti-sigma factor [Thermomonospora cellulosilytica]